MSVVVWASAFKYSSSGGDWTPYPVEVSNEIERVYSIFIGTPNVSNTPNVQLGLLSPLWAGYEVDIKKVEQIKTKSGKSVPIKRCVMAPDSALAKGFVWEYESDIPQHFVTYGLEMMMRLEAAYCNMTNRVRAKKKHPMVDMKKDLRLPYKIDLENMIQIRTDTGKRRSVQRRGLHKTYTLETSGSPGDQDIDFETAIATPVREPLPKENNIKIITKRHKTSSAEDDLSQYMVPVHLNKKRRKLLRNGSDRKRYGEGFKEIEDREEEEDKRNEDVDEEKKNDEMNAQGKERVDEQDEDDDVQMVESNSLLEVEEDEGKKDIGEELQVKETHAQPERKEDDREEALEEEVCSICLDTLNSASPFGEDGGPEAHEIVQLTQCKHRFHRLCLLEMCKAMKKKSCLQCPSCKQIYGEKTGTCPAGVMSWSVMSGTSVSGYEDYDTITVCYDIQPGIQGQEHPHPGQPFQTPGFPRRGYLPDTDKGRKVLKLFIKAWRRRLMFTVGSSITTGSDNVVTWNEIHHKTELHSNNWGHGYPDPGYLDNVTMELADHGVSEDSP